MLAVLLIGIWAVGLRVLIDRTQEALKQPHEHRHDRPH